MKMSNPRDFSRIFNSGKRIGGNYLTVITLENSVGHPRLGLAIARKHLKLACHRNRLKRIIRDSFRQSQFDLANIDMVVLSKTNMQQHSLEQISVALDKLWLTVLKLSGKNSN